MKKFKKFIIASWVISAAMWVAYAAFFIVTITRGYFVAHCIMGGLFIVCLISGAWSLITLRRTGIHYMDFLKEEE